MARVTTHPGEMLREEFMVPLGLSARALARKMDIPANRITAIINGTRSVTADTAIRLEKTFGMSAEFWMRLQDSHDLSKALAEVDYSGVKRIEPQAA
ncbi:MAG: HigA family addiction module antitoxin [Mesorhizobium sp.]|nr:HigA family addiction module antitoxin [Mesorhizobium sp.]